MWELHKNNKNITSTYIYVVVVKIWIIYIGPLKTWDISGKKMDNNFDMFTRVVSCIVWVQKMDDEQQKYLHGQLSHHALAHREKVESSRYECGVGKSFGTDEGPSSQDRGLWSHGRPRASVFLLPHNFLLNLRNFLDGHQASQCFHYMQVAALLWNREVK